MSTPPWRRVDVPGDVEIVAWRTGSGGDPIVAIHGLTTDHHSYDGVAAHLQHPGGVLAPDLRGRGASAKPARGYGLLEHANDLIRLLDQEGIARATLVGHSMGGYVALATALHHSTRVAGIVLLDSGWPRPTRPPSNAFTMLGGINTVILRMATTAPATFNAVRRDAWWMMANGPTASELLTIRARPLSERCPVMLIRPSDGFTAGSAPLIDSGTLHAITSSLPVVGDVRLAGATHYTMITDALLAERVAAEIDRFQGAITARQLAGAAEPAPLAVRSGGGAGSAADRWRPPGRPGLLP